MNKQEMFDFTSVQNKMRELEELFTRFSDILERADEAIHTSITFSSDSSLMGDSAQSLLKVWEDSTSNFPEFKKNFSKWSELVSKISLNNKEVEQVGSSTSTNKMSIQETTDGGHIITTVDGTKTITKFYDQNNHPIKIVTETLDSNNGCVRTTKTNTKIVTDVLKNDGFSVQSSVTETNGGVYKIVHENGYNEYLDQTGAKVDLHTYDASLLQDETNSFLKEEKNYK